jgi:hypothetical protein
VLVGGQAVNFWATYFADRLHELAAHAPYASKDIDFLGGAPAVRACAERLGGIARVATFDDMGTPSTGTVVYVDDDIERTLDFLGVVAGCDSDEIYETAIPVELTPPTGAAVTFRVMHPRLVLRSRAYNVAYIPGYATPHSLNQLRAAIPCARAFALEAFATAPRKTLTYNNDIFRLASYRAGPLVFVRHGIDVLEALAMSDTLPASFFSERLPRGRAFVDRRRAQVRAQQARPARRT